MSSSSSSTRDRTFENKANGLLSQAQGTQGWIADMKDEMQDADSGSNGNWGFHGR